MYKGPAPDPKPSKFTGENSNLVICSPEGASEAAIFAQFREQFGDAAMELADDSKLLLKVSVDDGSKTRPVLYAGVAHSVRFSEVIDLFNQRFCKGEGQEGAFLLSGGYAIKPNQSTGNVFMLHGHALTFHTKVDFSRLAYAS
jgi:hypothetical protein